MKIKMTRNQRGSQDGIRLEEFQAGRSYDMLDSLARAFVDDIGCAEYVEDAVTIEVPEEMVDDEPDEDCSDEPDEGIADKPDHIADDAPKETSSAHDVTTASGKPYQSLNSALGAATRKKLKDSHTVVTVNDGWVLRPKSSTEDKATTVRRTRSY